ncbi:MAG: hypothetical protein NC218_02390 [Acetobacter sp.]|nr:hypothetical protein [Acetobacter sp.]
MTFDLHYSNDKKADAFRMWIRRIYSVANILGMSYSELWELPEQEFLVLEELSVEVREKREQQKQELLEQRGGNR